MNNSKFVQESQASGPATKHDREVALSNIEQILSAIKGLKDNQDYFTVKRFILDPSLDSVERRIVRNMNLLKDDKDGSIKNKILQDQGFKIAFKKFGDLDELEKIYSLEAEKLTKYLRK